MAKTKSESKPTVEDAAARDAADAKRMESVMAAMLEQPPVEPAPINVGLQARKLTVEERVERLEDILDGVTTEPITEETEKAMAEDFNGQLKAADAFQSLVGEVDRLTQVNASRPSVPPRAPPVDREKQLDAWFKYHPPTDDTRPKFAAIGHAYKMCVETFENVSRGPRPVPPAGFVAITTMFRDFVEAIDEKCPSCADATAAVRHVRLARNVANDILCGNPTSVQMVYDQLVLAKFSANSAIACDGL